jgi:CHAT domain-containing protein
MERPPLLDHWCDDRRPQAEKFESLIPYLAALAPDELDRLVNQELYRASVTQRDALQSQCAFELGQLVIAIGEWCKKASFAALGYMLCGDVRNREFRYREASQFLAHAAELFLSVNDRFGWARTIIGQLLCAVEVENVPEVEATFDVAMDIFKAKEDYTRQVSLYHNLAYMYRRKGEFERSKEILMDSLKFIKATPEIDRRAIPITYLNLGLVYQAFGEIRTALRCYRCAQRCAKLLDFQATERAAQESIAEVQRASGQYRIALQNITRLLYEMRSDDPTTRVYSLLIALYCYLDLNANVQVEKLARVLLNEQLPDLLQPLVLVALAKAQTLQGEYNLASAHFEDALQRYLQKGLNLHANRVWLAWARAMVDQADQEIDLQTAQTALEFFTHKKLLVEIGQTYLLMARAYLKRGESELLMQYAQAALDLASATEIPLHRYEALTLLGHAHLLQNEAGLAETHFLAATAVIDAVQHEFTVSVRPGFLEDKGEAFHALVALYLAQEQPEKAFEAIEHARAQIFMNHLLERDALPFHTDEQTQPFLDQLAQLRPLYRTYMDTALSTTDSKSEADRQQALSNAQRVRDQIADLIRALEMLNKGAEAVHVHKAKLLSDLQSRIQPGALLVFYYDSGTEMHAFTLGSSGPVTWQRLGSSMEIKALIHDLDMYANRAIQRMRSVPQSENAMALLKHPYLNDKRLLNPFKKTGEALYNFLLRPLEHALNSAQRLLIVPYGHLHFLPYHLLHRGEGGYLIQTHEVAILPTASLLMQPPPRKAPGALVLYDDWNGQLKHADKDAQHIRELVGGESQEARHCAWERVIAEASYQTLHVIAHGSFDREYPELSFIQLGDRQWMLSDLLRQRLPYELVVLTSCESGQLKLRELAARVAVGDDLIGLGRTFLYAGAGALLASRWLIGDGLTLPLLESFYTHLQKGVPKAAAWREAQIGLLRELPDLHPVFWGTFQFFGSTEPFSQFAVPNERRE